MESSRPIRVVSLLAVAALLLAAGAYAQEARVTVSSRAGDRLTDRPPLRFEASAAAGVGFRVDSSARLQTMEGFGAAFNETGMIALSSLPASEQEDVLGRLFDPAKGAGLTMMKVDLGGNDFMSAGPWDTYAETPTPHHAPGATTGTALPRHFRSGGAAIMYFVISIGQNKLTLDVGHLTLITSHLV